MTGLPKAARLRKRRDFLKVQERGAKLSSELVTAMVLSQGQAAGPTRVGFTVSGKVGNAVVRNRVRRRLRELVRGRKARWPAGLDVVLVAKPPASEAPFEALERSVARLDQELRRRFS